MSKADLLFELGCEELPTSALKKAGTDLVAGITKRLKDAGLSHGEVRGIASPRRLGVLIRELDTAQADQDVVLRGPSLQVAYKDGEATPALLGFCRKQGIDPADLNEVETPKGTWLEYRGTQIGQSAHTLLPGLLKDAVDQLPLPKRMRWGATRAEFTRPVLWLVAMLDQDVLDLTLFDRQAGNQSRGHRVHSPEFMTIESPAGYFEQMASARVLADFNDRAQQVKALAQSLSVDGLEVVTDQDLVEEVAALVEWPVPLMGEFDPAFLDVPEEALVSSMKEHQKYFHVKHDGKLSHHFVTMANLESKDPALVVQGNERVLNARLSDAKFFWDTDLKTPLADRAAKLDKIVFHELLGTLGDKTRRAGGLAAMIAPALGADAEQARQASSLAKCDLLSEMVLEFSDLQGLMGTYYARREGYPAEIAEALVEVYQPAGQKDALPSTATGAAIALGDKLDTLVGLFAVGQPPTGSKDPFALRRAAIGILRIILERNLSVDISTWVAAAVSELDSFATEPDAAQQVLTFFSDRLRVMLQEQDISAEVFAAVKAGLPGLNPVQLRDRAQVLKQALGSDDLAAVAAGSKRVANILSKAGNVSTAINSELFSLPAEIALAAAVADVQSSMDPNEFAQALNLCAQLRGPVDAFFDQVMVNDDDSMVRQNRLALLAQLQQVFAQVADLSLLSNG